MRMVQRRLAAIVGKMTWNEMCSQADQNIRTQPRRSVLQFGARHASRQEPLFALTRERPTRGPPAQPRDPPAQPRGPARPKAGPSQISGNLEIWDLEIWKFGIQQNLKIILKIKIGSSQNAGKAWISRKKSSWPHLGPFQANVSMGRKNRKN